ncbi:MAG: ATP-binding protein [Actinobacteria bacterium]|nr:ATP-binding protein [Actinomycetota bacterium]
MSDSLELIIPVVPEQVATARIFIAAAGRQLGVDEDSIEDLKIAISEACTGAIQAHQAAENSDPIKVTLTPSTDHLEIRVVSTLTDESPVPDWDPKTPTYMFQKVLAEGLVKALFPDAEWVSNQREGTFVKFSLPIAS